MRQFLIGALLGLMSIFAYEFGGVIEGRFFPVMGTLSIYEPEEFDGQDTTKWRGHAKKYRSCNFVRVEWYLGPRNGRHVIVDREIGFTDRPQVRDTGEIQWNGILVNLPAQATLANSFADAIHRCGWGLWDVRTRFYTSAQDG